MQSDLYMMGRTDYDVIEGLVGHCNRRRQQETISTDTHPTVRTCCIRRKHTGQSATESAEEDRQVHRGRQLSAAQGLLGEYVMTSVELALHIERAE